MTYVHVKGGTNAGWRRLKARTCPICDEKHWGATLICIRCRRLPKPHR